jgi:hypothetical protein
MSLILLSDYIKILCWKDAVNVVKFIVLCYVEVLGMVKKFVNLHLCMLTIHHGRVYCTSPMKEFLSTVMHFYQWS